MLYSMRHGEHSMAAALAATSSRMRFNMAFFDGHVQTMDAHTAMNPNFWIPKGSVIPNPGKEMTPEAQAAYNPSGNPYIVP